MDHRPKHKTWNFLEENIRESIHEHGIGKDFFPVTKNTSNTREIDKLVFTKIKIFYSSKDILRKCIGNPETEGKIHSTISDEGFMFRICKEHQQTIKIETTQFF